MAARAARAAAGSDAANRVSVGLRHCATSDFVPMCNMEYKGLRYTIRVGIVRHEWSVAIHPVGFEPIERLVTGKRRLAELRAFSLIDTWLRQQRAQEV